MENNITFVLLSIVSVVGSAGLIKIFSLGVLIVQLQGRMDNFKQMLEHHEEETNRRWNELSAEIQRLRERLHRLEGSFASREEQIIQEIIAIKMKEPKG